MCAGPGERRKEGGMRDRGVRGGEGGLRLSLLCRPPAHEGLWTLGLLSRARPADLSASIPARPGPAPPQTFLRRQR